MTSRELTSGFNFWSRGHLRMAVMHLPIKFGADIFIWSDQVIDIFLRSKMAADAILDFQVMWIRLFRRVDSVVFVLRTKFGSNIRYNHWDRRTYDSDFHLMTSRKLTSGFDFWSRGHLRMAVLHLHIKFGAYIFIQPGVIVVTWSYQHVRDASSHKIWCRYLYLLQSFWHFPEVKDGGRRHLGFVGGAMGRPTKAHSLCVLPVKISS